MRKRKLVVLNSTLRVRDPPHLMRRPAVLDRAISEISIARRKQRPLTRRRGREKSFSARNKLNWAAVNGATLFAALVAGVTHSLWAGGGILALLVVEAIATGQIRLRWRG